MKASIKSVSCSDRQDFETWRPGRLDDVYLGIELRIGANGDEQADIFQIVIATPQSIQGRPERTRCKLIVIEQYHWQTIKATLERWVGECDRSTWRETVECLRHRFDWEYDGMAAG